MKYKIIAADFDGTLCEEVWPTIGAPNIELINYLKEEKKKGAKIILWTCRNGALLADAVLWCTEHGLEFDAVNENIPELLEAYHGVDSRKITATEYIDDKMCTRFKLPFKKEE